MASMGYTGGEVSILLSTPSEEKMPHTRAVLGDTGESAGSHVLN